MWAEGNSGPGCRVLYGKRKRDAILIGGLTWAEIRRKITLELERDGHSER